MTSRHLQDLAGRLRLSPDEVAALAAMGARTPHDVHSIVTSFPSAVPTTPAANPDARRSEILTALVPHLRAGFPPAPAQAGQPFTWGAAEPDSPGPSPYSDPWPAAVPAGSRIDPHQASPIMWDLEPWPVQDQWTRGTCVAFSAVACCEYVQWKYRRVAAPALSEQFLYWAIQQQDRQANGERVWLRDASRVLSTIGVCDRALFPYVAEQASIAGDPPPDGVRRAAAANTFTQWRYYDKPGAGGAALLLYCLKDGPVAISVPVYQDPADAAGPTNWTCDAAIQDGSVTTPTPALTLCGGHSPCVVGFEPDEEEPAGGFFIVRNSWGLRWGRDAPEPGSYAPRQGYGYLRASYIEQCCWEILQFQSN